MGKESKKSASRYVTAALYLPIFIIICAFANTIVMNIFITLISFIALREYYKAFEDKKEAKPISIVRLCWMFNACLSSVYP